MIFKKFLVFLYMLGALSCTVIIDYKTCILQQIHYILLYEQYVLYFVVEMIFFVFK